MLLAAVRDTATDVALVAGAVTAFLTATALVWSRILRPSYRILRQAESVVPILNQIASEFRPNHGSSLHDRITRLTELATDSAQVGADLDKRVDKIETYLHEFRHEIRSITTINGLVKETTPQLLGAVHDQLKELGVSMDALSDLRHAIQRLSQSHTPPTEGQAS